MKLAFVLIFIVTSAVIISGTSDEVCLKLPNRRGEDERRHLPKAQGPPGRRGPQGAQGAKGDVGLSGVRGLPGSCTCGPDDIEELREENRRLADSVEKLSLTHNEKLIQCSVGLKSGRVRDGDITASSAWDNSHLAHFARLDNHRSPGSLGAWASGINPNQPPTAGDWIQIDLRAPTLLTGVVSQGRPVGDTLEQWVTSYKISYGNSTDNLQTIQQGGQDLTFQGNRDRSSHVTNRFPGRILARYLRLIVETFHGHVILRLEFLTC
ncbi:lactadherin-like [Clavelina lepadiformis]|uniref:F5/8 type C domain-containing protein n=1 Tax=Clavelina lepadiformis TaxID=159417 RepID=A0ABP0FPY1_CLALP